MTDPDPKTPVEGETPTGIYEVRDGVGTLWWRDHDGVLHSGPVARSKTTETGQQDPAKLHDFSIRFRNDRMGFTKSFNVQAQNAHAAIALGEVLLAEKNYVPADFEAIEIIRGRQIGT